MVKMEPSNFLELLPELIIYFKSQVTSFKARNISRFLKYWRAITSDQEILKTVEGMPIEFIDIPPQTPIQATSIREGERPFIFKEIQTL